MNYLASPPLVVAYALAGTMDIDLYHEPNGHDGEGGGVSQVIDEALRSEMLRAPATPDILEGDER